MRFLYSAMLAMVLAGAPLLGWSYPESDIANKRMMDHLWTAANPKSTLDLKTLMISSCGSALRRPEHLLRERTPISASPSPVLFHYVVQSSDHVPVEPENGANPNLSLDKALIDLIFAPERTPEIYRADHPSDLPHRGVNYSFQTKLEPTRGARPVLDFFVSSPAGEPTRLAMAESKTGRVALERAVQIFKLVRGLPPRTELSVKVQCQNPQARSMGTHFTYDDTHYESNFATVSRSGFDEIMARIAYGEFRFQQIFVTYQIRDAQGRIIQIESDNTGGIETEMRFEFSLDSYLRMSRTIALELLRDASMFAGEPRTWETILDSSIDFIRQGMIRP